MDDVETVAAACGLPGAVVAVESVGRAWSNRLYRVTTTEANFAVKELLNPWSNAGLLDWVTEAAVLEQAAIGACVQAPPVVLNPSGQVVTTLGERHLRVHRWVDGAQPCPEAPVSEQIAASIGRDLARTHALAVQPERTDCFPRLHARTARGWASLVDELKVAPEWADRAAAVTGLMTQIADRCDQWQALSVPTVMSHGDVDPKNVVLDTEGLAWLVDWDVAAPWRAGDELARTALSFAGDDRELARVLIDAYAEQAPLPVLDEHSLTADLVIGLDWIDQCLRRASGLADCDDQRRAEASQLAVAELDSLAASIERANSLPDWLGL